jgi:hypothetical protein
MNLLKLIILVFLISAFEVHSKDGSEKKRKKKRQGRSGNHKSAGIKASKQGDLNAAIHHFRKHVVANPEDAAGYNNLGVALMRQGIELDDVRLLQQSEQSFMTSVDISGSTPSTNDNLRLIDQYLTDRGAKGSSAAEVNVNGEVGLLSPDEQRKKDNNILRQRINSACQEKQLKIKVRDSDRKSGRLSNKKLSKAHHLLNLCGVVILEKLFDPKFMDNVLVEQSKVVDTFLNGIELDPTKTNSTWSEQRSPGRYELLSPMAPPFTSEELLRNPLLLPLVERALGTNRIEVDTHSSVTSLGNTPAQHWHRDAGFIFKNQVKEQLPPHGLVVFIPLIDVTKSMGPTNFLTGSHIQCKPRDEKEINLANWILKECPFVGPSVQTPAPKGSAIVFDMRILHRGLANKKPIRRPQLYVTFFQEWFVDHVNFNAKQSSQFDMLPKKARKMLSRVDTKQYVLDLENKLKDMGIDVTELQSSYDYKKNSFSAAANDV